MIANAKISFIRFIDLLFVKIFLQHFLFYLARNNIKLGQLFSYFLMRDITTKHPEKRYSLDNR